MRETRKKPKKSFTSKEASSKKDHPEVSLLAQNCSKNLNAETVFHLIKEMKQNQLHPKEFTLPHNVEPHVIKFFNKPDDAFLCKILSKATYA